MCSSLYNIAKLFDNPKPIVKVLMMLLKIKCIEFLVKS